MTFARSAAGIGWTAYIPESMIRVRIGGGVERSGFAAGPSDRE